jgi:hypothetical protein
LRQVAGAVARLTREIAERGRAEADAPDLAAAAEALLATFGSEEDVVEIEALFREGEGEPIMRRGESARAERGPDGAIELVALADRLRQAAEQLGSARSESGRHLFLYGLVMELRPLAREARTERPFLEPFLRAALGAINRGAAARAPADFAGGLRDAADALSRAAESRDAVFVREELSPIVERLDRHAGRRGAVAPAAPTPEPVATAWPAEEEIVPIEALAPDQLAQLRPFERSFSTLHRLEREAAKAPPPIPVPAASPAAEPPVETDVVPIETLLYRGRRALERADRVRLVLSDALRAQRPFGEIEPLVSELIDLVPLALAE